MNILQLPNDVVKHVWSYLTRIEDIVRFASTCREIQLLAFEVPRTIILYPTLPSLIFNYIFSRDLRLLTGLHYQMSQDAQFNDWRAEKLKIISTLNNLRVLEVGTHTVATHCLRDLALLIQKTTSLEELTAPFPVDSCGLGEILGSHKKLTKLIITRTVFKSIAGSGLEKLQQLSSLSLQIHNSTVLHDVIKLTNLTALQIRIDILLAEYEQEPMIPFKEISQLTNLEMIGVEGTEQLFPWSVLETLPKLSATFLSGSYLTNVHLCSYDIATRLTRLEFKDYGEDFCEAEHLSKFVNLRELQCPNILFGPFRFEKFKHLTRLEFPCDVLDEDEIQFPSQLKCLAIRSISVTGIFLKSVLATTSLEELSFEGGFRSKELASQISRLTNLKTLEFNRSMPAGIGKDLKPLLNLRNIAINDLMHGDVNELKDLTQICQLTIKQIRALLTTNGDLPLDVIGSIFVFVDEPRQICLMRLVCRKWADLTTNNLWGRLCARRWRNNPKEAELDKYWLVPVINNGAGSIIDWRSVYWIKHLWDRAMIALAKERTPTKEGSFFNNYGTNIYTNNVINIMESGWLKHAVKFHSKEGITLPQITIGSGAFVHQSDRIYPTDENMLQSVLSFWIELTLVLLYNATTQDQITQIFDGIILETYELYISRMTNLPIKRLVNLAKTVVQIAREKKDQINLFVEWVPKQMFFHYDYQQFNPFIGTIVGLLEQRAIAFGPSTDTAAIQDLIRACMDLYYAWLPRVDKRIWFSYAPFQSYSVTLHAMIRFFNVGNIEFLRPILDEYLQVCDDIHHKMAAIQTVASVASNNVFDRVPRDSEGMQRLVQFKSDMFHSYIKKYYVLIDDVNAINLLLANLISTYTWLTSYPSDDSTNYSQFFADLLRDIFAKPYFNELKAAEEAMQFTNVLTGLNEEFIPSLAQICKDDTRWRIKAFGYLVNIISKLDEITKYKELLLTLFNAVFADPTFDDLFLFRKWWSIMRPLITKEEFKQISESLEGHPFKQELDVQITNKSTQY